MAKNGNLTKTDVLIVGAGPAGLAAAITLKKAKPSVEVCVVEKGAEAGNHNLSGAAFEIECLEELMASIDVNWKESDDGKEILSNKVDNDNVLFMLGGKLSFNISIAIKIAKKLGLGFGQMSHRGDYSVSISKLSRYLAKVAAGLGIEVLCGFAAEDIDYDKENGKAVCVKLVERGRSRTIWRARLSKRICLFWRRVAMGL